MTCERGGGGCTVGTLIREKETEVINWEDRGGKQGAGKKEERSKKK